MIKVKCVIDGDPVPKARPRFTRSGHTYTPKTTSDYEKQVARCYKEQTGQFFTGPVSMNFYFIFSVPKSASKKNAAKMLSGEIRYTGRKDIDNLVKSCMDGLLGVAYKDDKQVYRIGAKKQYGEVSKTIIEIVGYDDE